MDDGWPWNYSYYFCIIVCIRSFFISNSNSYDVYSFILGSDWIDNSNVKKSFKRDFIKFNEDDVYHLCINMTSLAYCYSAGQIGAAFGISAIYFACLAIVGKTTKIDLSKVGNICWIGLLAMIISQLFFMIFRVSMDVRLWSVIGLLLFTGLTAWDIQKMNYLLNGYEDEKISIYMALQLYLDFLNIFLYILQLIGNRDN